MALLALPQVWPHFLIMDLIYPINFVGHDDWMHSGYAPKLAHGDVITRDGEVLGSWRVVDYNHKDEYSSGRFEFILNGEDVVKFAEDFAMLDVRTSRGFALSNLTKTIREWYKVMENGNLGRFACLGWGSLIWEPGDLPISHEWREDGPKLPLEFARKSADGRMTLVVCKEGTVCPTLWNTLSSTLLEEARAALAKREGLPSVQNAAFWTSSGASDHHGAEHVGAWARKLGFAGVVWTGLPPKSPVTNKNNDHPSVEDVIAHLSGLNEHSGKRAEEYVRRAPIQIATTYRTRMEEEFGWDGLTYGKLGK